MPAPRRCKRFDGKYHALFQDNPSINSDIMDCRGFVENVPIKSVPCQIRNRPVPPCFYLVLYRSPEISGRYSWPDFPYCGFKGLPGSLEKQGVIPQIDRRRSIRDISIDLDTEIQFCYIAP